MSPALRDIMVISGKIMDSIYLFNISAPPKGQKGKKKIVTSFALIKEYFDILSAKMNSVN